MPLKEPINSPINSLKNSDGANLIASRIRAYWSALGYDVTVVVERMGGVEPHLAIRSNLVGGLPPDFVNVVGGPIGTPVGVRKSDVKARG